MAEWQAEIHELRETNSNLQQRIARLEHRADDVSAGVDASRERSVSQCEQDRMFINPKFPA